MHIKSNFSFTFCRFCFNLGYVFPDEIHKTSPDYQSHNNTQTADGLNTKSKSPEQDWQFVIPVPAPGEKGSEENDDTDILDLEAKDGFETIQSDNEVALATNGSSSNENAQTSGIIPAARARLASLRDLGAKKIGALKLKLIENKIKSNERGKIFV